MQVVLIAGGLGTRLRPLTRTRPKALLPLLNRPLILHILERLPAIVDEVLVAASYRTEALKEFFRSRDVGRPVTVVREKRPLGTGGCLKNLEDRIGGPFLALNADVVSSLPLGDFAAAHRRFRGVGTIAVWEVDDPSAFGVVAMDGTRITKFVEKPPKEKAPSRLVNAGAYVLEPEVLAAMPADAVVSLERDVFPKLLRKGLHAFRFDGFWADAGTLEHFLVATETLLRVQGSEISRRATILPSARVTKPVAFAADARIQGIVGPMVSVGASCVIGEATVSRSVLFDSVTVGNRTRIEGSLIGEGSVIGPDATVLDSVIGDRVSIAAGAVLEGERVAA